MGRCPTPRQGEVLPAPPARLRRAITRRGRTYRTYRTYRTAAAPLDFPKPKRGVRSPPCSHRPPGRTCALRTHGPPQRSLLSRGRFGALRLHGLPLWSFVSFVIAAQRSASSPPGAADRASTSGAPPSFQASKLSNFQKKGLAIGVGDLLSLMGFVWGCSVPRRRGLRGGYSSLLSRGGPA